MSASQVSEQNITYTNSNSMDGDSKKNILVTANGGDGGLNGVLATDAGATTAYKYQYTTAPKNPATDSTSIGNQNFHILREDLRAIALQQPRRHRPERSWRTLTVNTIQSVRLNAELMVTSMMATGSKPSPLFMQTFNAPEGHSNRLIDKNIAKR